MLRALRLGYSIEYGARTLTIYRQHGASVSSRWFRQLRELRDNWHASGVPAAMLRELSMGMSGDFDVAVQEGATIVRVGTAIFGSRHVEQ